MTTYIRISSYNTFKLTIYGERRDVINGDPEEKAKCYESITKYTCSDNFIYYE